MQTNGVGQLENVIFIHSEEFISSYDLIGQSKFMIVYNSSIGLEGALLGKAVLCGGDAWYAQFPTVYSPKTAEGFRRQAEVLLNAEKIEVPEAFQKNARRLLYYQNYRAALPFDQYLDKHSLRGFVRFKLLDPVQLHPDHSPAIQAIVNGLETGQKVFVLEDPLDEQAGGNQH